MWFIALPLVARVWVRVWVSSFLFLWSCIDILAEVLSTVCSVCSRMGFESKLWVTAGTMKWYLEDARPVGGRQRHLHTFLAACSIPPLDVVALLYRDRAGWFEVVAQSNSSVRVSLLAPSRIASRLYASRFAQRCNVGSTRPCLSVTHDIHNRKS